MNVIVPQKWSDLSGAQLIRVASAILKDRVDLTFLFFALLDFKWYRLKDWIAIFRLRQVPATEFHPHVTWLLGDDYLREWVISQFKGYRGPDSHWVCLSWYEFTMVDTLFCRYADTKDRRYLHHLSAALFRTPGQGPEFNPLSEDFSGDVRRPFNSNIPDAHVDRVSRWPETFHDAVFLNYSGMRREIEREFPRVFSSDEPDQSPTSMKGWKPVTITVSGTKFGNIKETEKTPFREVLRSLEMNAVELEKMQEKYGRD